MLSIRMLSGAEVASIPVEELSDVRALKQTLHLFHGLPPRFRQRLVLRGDPLDDATKLDAPLDLELVLLEYSTTKSEELILAAARASTSEVEAILQQPQHPDVVNASGSSPLIEASLHCHVEVVRLLLEAGADKDLTNNDGISALMRASLCGHVEVVRLLLEAGADKNSTCNDGLSALRLASVLGHVEVVRLLLDAGADKNSAGTPGITALVLAASAGHAEVLRLLLDAGAGKSSTCNDGRTALVLASGKGNVEALRLLLDADVGTTFPYLSVCIALMEACYQRHAATVHLLLRWLLEKATPKLLVGCVLPAATVAASAANPVVVISSGDMSATNNRHCWTL
ncbi:ANKRD50, partial [Symbiodinium sp. KB8]